MDYSKSDLFNILNYKQTSNFELSQPLNMHTHLQPCVLRKTFPSSVIVPPIHESYSFPIEFSQSPDTQRASPNPATSVGDVSSTVNNNLLENSETALPEITTDPPPTGEDLIDFGRSFGRAERNHRALSILDFDPLLSEAPTEEHIESSIDNSGDSAVVADLAQLQLAPQPPSSVDIFSVEHLENLSRQSPSQSSASSPSVVSPASASPMKSNRGKFSSCYVVVFLSTQFC